MSHRFFLTDPNSEEGWRNEFSNIFETAYCKPSLEDPVYWLPELLNDACSYSNEYNFEWKKYLIEKNSEKKICSKERFTFYTPNIVVCVFDICKMLKQPPEVRYLAIDILDRFLVQHFFNVRRAFDAMERQSLANWAIIKDRILDQSLLRILTCIQLAIKHCWSYNKVTATTVQEVMKGLGHTWQYSKRSIVKSEARIFENLSFNIPNTTPLTYLEMFFEEFQKPGIIQIRISLYKFFITCIHVLDLAIIYHQQIYSKLIESLKNNWKDGNYCINEIVTSLKGEPNISGWKKLLLSYAQKIEHKLKIYYSKKSKVIMFSWQRLLYLPHQFWRIQNPIYCLESYVVSVSAENLMLKCLGNTYFT